MTRDQTDGIDDGEARVRCKTVLLSDLPTNDDAFGGHRRIAEAVAQLICTKHGGKAIALIGSWGSGKSSIVRMLSELLETTVECDIDCIVFDAWAHKGDYLRRSFLEYVIDKLVKTHWLAPGKEWLKEKEKLAGHARDRETWRSTKLTPIGFLAVVMAVSVPLGVALIAQAASLLPQWTLWLGIALCSYLPAALILVLFLCWLDPGIDTLARRWIRSGWDRHSAGKAAGRSGYEGPILSELSVLASGGTEWIKEECYETPSPTPLQFQTTFHNILKCALADTGRRLLVVIDNLDRVDDESAREIWTTMQTFFGFPQQESVGDSLDRFWLLVPFVGSMPETLWKSEATPQTDERFSRGKHFLEKTFQIRFRVPRPLLSKWKAYLMSMLGTAFPKHDEEDFRPVYRLFDLLSRGNAHTPRKMKEFVNNLGAIHRVWCERIPLAIQALYVLISDSLDDKPLVEAVRKAAGERATAMLSEPRWIEFIAAIHHGVAIEHALEVTLRRPLLECLEMGQQEALQGLVSEVRGATAVLEKLVRTEAPLWAAEAPELLLEAAHAVSGLTTTTETTAAQTALSRNLQAQDELPLSNPRACVGLRDLLESTPGSARRQLANSIAQKLAVPASVIGDAGQVDAASLRDWGELLVAIRELLSELELDDVVETSFRVPGKSELCLSVLVQLAEQGMSANRMAVLVPRDDPEQLPEELAERLRDEVAVEAHHHTTSRAVLRIIQSLDRGERSERDEELQSSYATIAESVLAGCAVEPDQEASIESLESRLRILMDLWNSGSEDASNGLDQLGRSGMLASYLGRAAGSEGISAFALVTCLILLFDPQGRAATRSTLSRLGQQAYLQLLRGGRQPREEYPNREGAIEALVNTVCEFRLVTEILDRAGKHEECKDLLDAILTSLLPREDLLVQVDADCLLRFPGLLVALLGSRYEELVFRHAQDHTFLKRLKTAEDARIRIDLCYMAWRLTKREVRNEYQAALVRLLRAVEPEMWHEEMGVPSVLSTAIRELRSKAVRLDLGEGLASALQQHAIELIGESRLDDQGLVPVKHYGCGLSTQHRGELDRMLCGVLTDESSSLLGAFLKRFGNYILSTDVVHTRVNPLLQAVVPAFLGRKALEELRWLQNACSRGLVRELRRPVYLKLRPIARGARTETVHLQTTEANLIREIAKHFYRAEKPRRKRKPSRQPDRQRKPR